ncbi:alpha/beta fold hydrolase [Blastopirellula retiformator]|uniref:Dihydrolipoyllysine-residue acetyltransferase component of acetoin cleaving system n=1 Tax=Blastopirellula retiformator TaxID=2527970 RepID=A0A5C5V8B0_9BACT|nr:alpha/beta hydrolase [Blastopirellula retiformator]TWT34193.1 Dihydrolipoyllysine-residue acetyltransferase component of acetoin cleaving system [Blastopirellula retiformator]
MTAVDEYFDSDGVKIRYVEQGYGEPVVLMHGFTRNIEHGWVNYKLLDHLSELYRVIAMDARGHGKSDKPHEDVYGRQMYADVARLLDHLKIESANLVGYSMGGRMALNATIHYPERVRSTLLLAAGAGRPGDAIELWDELQESLAQHGQLHPLMKVLWSSRNPPSDRQLAAMNANLMEGNDPLALAAVARGYRELGVTSEEVASIQTPLQVVIGEEDAAAKHDADRLCEDSPHATRIIVPNADHFTLLLKPQLGNYIVDFLQQVS